MPDWPELEVASPLFIHTYSKYSLGYEIRTAGAAAVATVTWVANAAVFIPFSIPWPYPVRRLFWINGSTASSNVDIGIYSEAGARIYSKGSTAQSGASVVQYVTPATPFVLPVGRYYFAWNCDGTTSRAFGTGLTAAQMKFLGMLQQAVGAITLPSPATFATVSTVPAVPVCGITKLGSGF